MNNYGLVIALMMEAARTSNTSLYYNETTRLSIPVGSIFILVAVRISDPTN
jgi:hypothetical protein